MHYARTGVLTSSCLGVLLVLSFVTLHSHLLLAASSKKSSGIVGFLPLILIAVVLIVVMRSQKRRTQAAAQVTQSIEPGARVLTASGQFGTVVSIDEGVVKLEIATGVVVEYVVGAIARVVTPSDEELPATPAIPDNGGLEGSWDKP